MVLLVLIVLVVKVVLDILLMVLIFLVVLVVMAVVAEAEAEVLDSATASPEEVLWLKVGPVVVVPASPGQLEMELAEAGAVDTPVAEAAWG